MDSRILVRKWYLEMWNQWKFDLFKDILNPEITFRGSLNQRIKGFIELREYMENVKWIFPDFQNEIQLTIEEKDKVFAKVKFKGTHTRKLLGYKATGKKIEYDGAAIFTIRNIKIVDVWVLGDLYNLTKQLSF